MEEAEEKVEPVEEEENNEENPTATTEINAEPEQPAVEPEGKDSNNENGNNLLSEEKKSDDIITEENKEEPPPQPVEETPVPEKPKEPEKPVKKDNEIAIIIRPICDGWQMGEDWPVFVSYLFTFLDIKALIETERGISRHRIQLRIRGKTIVPSREKWTLRRMGIFDGYVIQAEPTLSGSWWWNPRDYYVENVLSHVERLVDERNGGIFYSELVTLTAMPPPLQKTSLRVFLRSYPERVHIHCNTALGTYWISRAKGLIDLPTFSSMPHDLGKLSLPLIDQVPPFDWDNYKDIDDKYAVYEFEGVDSKGNPIMKKKSSQKEEDGDSSREGEGEGDNGDGEEGDAEAMKGEDEEGGEENGIVGENENKEGANSDQDEEGKHRNEDDDGEGGNTSGKEKEIKGIDGDSPSSDS
jgi:hypothetical protein